MTVIEIKKSLPNITPRFIWLLTLASPFLELPFSGTITDEPSDCSRFSEVLSTLTCLLCVPFVAWGIKQSGDFWTSWCSWDEETGLFSSMALLPFVIIGAELCCDVFIFRSDSFDWSSILSALASLLSDVIEEFTVPPLSAAVPWFDNSLSFWPFVGMTVPARSECVSALFWGIGESVELSSIDLTAVEFIIVFTVFSFASSFVWFSTRSDAEFEFLEDGSSCSNSGFKSWSM